MRYYTVLQDICAQLNDPDMLSLKARAKSHFINAISFLIDEGKVTQDDIPGYYKSEEVVLGAGGYNLGPKKVLKLLKVYIDPLIPPAEDEEVVVTMKSSEEIARMSAITELRPTKYDLFVVREGDLLKGYINTSASNYSLAGDRVNIVWIEDIDNSGWNDAQTTGTDFQDAGNYLFSFAFTRRAIRRAVETLMVEDRE